MKRIELTRGKFTIIDDCDYEMVSKYKWHARRDRNRFYAGRCEKVKGTRKVLNFKMHREILKPPFGVQIDHINGDGLDNRRENLRVCTPSQNSCNRRNKKDSLSDYKGVYRAYTTKSGEVRWNAVITLKGEAIYLGYFETEEQAALAYNVAAVKYHGEFARLNKVDRGEDEQWTLPSVVTNAGYVVPE